MDLHAMQHRGLIISVTWSDLSVELIDWLSMYICLMLHFSPFWNLDRNLVHEYIEYIIMVHSPLSN